MSRRASSNSKTDTPPGGATSLPPEISVLQTLGDAASILDVAISDARQASPEERVRRRDEAKRQADLWRRLQLEYEASDPAAASYSCFLSHAAPDGPFADQFRKDLIANDISCFHYRYDMRPGEYWRVQIEEAIKTYDKLVLICSKRSLQRTNVVDEIISAREREREAGFQKLFPLRLDNFILSAEMLKIADEKMASGEWREDWVRNVRAYHIPDFRKWRRPEAYQAELTKVVEALKNPPRRGRD